MRLKRQRARFAALIQHIRAFADPAAPVGMWHQPESKPGCFSAMSFLLNANAERFVEDCYAHGWVLERFDWATWAKTDEARSLRDQPGALASARERQLAQLLTVAIRQDRFVEGALAAAFASGLILGVLQRAEQLDRERAQPPG